MKINLKKILLSLSIIAGAMSMPGMANAQVGEKTLGSPEVMHPIMGAVMPIYISNTRLLLTFGSHLSLDTYFATRVNLPL